MTERRSTISLKGALLFLAATLVAAVIVIVGVEQATPAPRRAAVVAVHPEECRRAAASAVVVEQYARNQREAVIEALAELRRDDVAGAKTVLRAARDYAEIYGEEPARLVGLTDACVQEDGEET